MAVAGAVMVPHPPLIIPEVGRGQEREIQATIDAYQEAARQLASWKPETVVVLSPHTVMYADYFHISPGKKARGDFGNFRAPQVKLEVEYDTEFVQLLTQEAQARELPAGTLGERDRRLDHAAMIPPLVFKSLRSGVSCGADWTFWSFFCQALSAGAVHSEDCGTAEPEDCGDRKR